ncbi:MAG: methylated-DNA--[protein]-cysteine S-methyltransferase [Kiloniellales bacterium]
MNRASLATPIGCIGLVEHDGAIVEIDWTQGETAPSTPLLQRAAEQIRAYFAGELTVFDLPLSPAGGEFQQAVMQALIAIPFGQTRTYGEIAKDLDTYGQPVGAACGANPIPIVIPCHRVLSANGLGGFSARGGVETKIALLKHENAYPFLV